MIWVVLIDKALQYNRAWYSTTYFEILTSNSDLENLSENLKKYQGGSQFSKSLVAKNTYLLFLANFI